MKILFVCSGNTCRSPMARALLCKLLDENRTNMAGTGIEVYSAGICAIPGQPPSPQAIEAMTEFGVDLSGHRSQGLNSILLDEADLILTMTGQQCCILKEKFPRRQARIFALAEFAGYDLGDVVDPFGLDLEMYQQSARQLNSYVIKILARLGTDYIPG